MTDVVVTLPRTFGLERWVAEGDPAGAPTTGQRYYWSVPTCPKIEPGERVYVVYAGRLIGYAPLVDIVEVLPPRGPGGRKRWLLVREGGAVAVTIAEQIPGFRGFRYRWWNREEEIPFLEWKELA